MCHSAQRGVGFPACITGHIIRGEEIASRRSASRGVLHPKGRLGRPPRSVYRGLGRPPFRDTLDTIEYGQQAGGMSPDEMHSCLVFLIHNIGIGIRTSIDTDVHNKTGMSGTM